MNRSIATSRSLFAIGTGAVLLTLGWLMFWRDARPSFDIQTVEIDRGAIERTIAATGSVQALVTVDVSSQLSGQISEVGVDFNSPVSKGDMLAVIDPRTFVSRVASAEANLEIARANVEIQVASISKAEVLRDLADRALKRQKELIESRTTSAANLDQAQTQFKAAVADVAVARAQLANARAAVSQREADLAQAKLDLDRTRIRTPIDGVVIARNVDPGSTVAASLQAPILFQIAQDLKQIEILVLVDEADIGAIETGQDVSFTVDAFPLRAFRGTVAQVRIAGEVKSNVVTYTVVVRAENPQQKLLPGMTATVRIVTGRRDDVLRVPHEAVRFTPPLGMATTQPVEQPNRDEAIVASLSEKLKLSSEQRDRFSEALAASRRAEPARTGAQLGTRGRDAAPSADSTTGSIRPERPKTSRASTNSAAEPSSGRVGLALEPILTPEQAAAFAPLREAWRDSTRPATVWVETPQGATPHRLILGLADADFSEILHGELAEGTKVVVRARRTGAAASEGRQRGERGPR